jgi:arsenical pump membrane protein
MTGMTRLSWSVGLGGLGVTLAVIAVAVDHHDAAAAAGQTWTPFVLVSGLLLVGLVAQTDGLFDALGRRATMLPGGPRVFLVSASALVLLVTATLNLDTSVVFLTPLLVAAARQNGYPEGRVLALSLLMANSSSLFLPGSNLTNLIVVGSHTSGVSFLSVMWPAAVSASVVTAAVLCARVTSAGPVLPSAIPTTNGRSLGALAVVAVLALVLVLPNAALAVLGVGLLVAVVRLAQGRLGLSKVTGVLNPAALVGLFGLAVAAGTLGRAWSGPSQALAHLGSSLTAIVAGAGALAINNLPASALLAAHAHLHTAALLVGLNLGPNLCATGSLAWLLWAQSARGAGAQPSLREVSRLGAVIVPLSMAAALGALWLR